MTRPCLLVVLLAACACRPVPRESALNTEANVREAVDSFHSAFVAEDSARLGRLVASDSSMIFYGTARAEIQRGRAEFLTKHENEDWAQLDGLTFSAPTELSIQLGSDLAVAIYHTNLGFRVDGQDGMLPLRMMLTFRSEAGEWKIIQGAASRIGGG